MTFDRFDPNADYARSVVTKMLEARQYHCRRSIAMNNLRFDFGRLTYEADRMYVEMCATVWGEKLQDEVVTLSVKYPATWWQAFKAAHFPAWAIRRWPVRETEVSKDHTFRTIALLPEFKYEMPDRYGVIKIISEVTP